MHALHDLERRELEAARELFATLKAVPWGIRRQHDLQVAYEEAAQAVAEWKQCMELQQPVFLGYPREAELASEDDSYAADDAEYETLIPESKVIRLRQVAEQAHEALNEMYHTGEVDRDYCLDVSTALAIALHRHPSS